MSYEPIYFDKAEFVTPHNGFSIDWYPRLSNVLLVRLDLFRYRIGLPINVSKAKGAIGRTDNTTSQHNFSHWGEVRAIDVFPDGLLTMADAYNYRDIAIECGFTGIGIYPDKSPSPMMHLDVRENREIGQPALWGQIGGKYVSFDEAAQLMGV